MPKIYLSPSTQEYNPYVTGAGSEEYFMNLLADAMEPVLLLNGIQFSRNTPDMTAASSIRQANAGQYDFYLALHSNASGPGAEGRSRGILAFYYPTSANGRRAAELFVENLRDIYPLPEKVSTRATTSLGEIRQPRFPSVLLELGYHDNPDDALWIQENLPRIAANLVLSLTEYFGLPYTAPTPQPGQVSTVSGGPVNLRSGPSLQSTVTARLPDGDGVTVYGRYQDWYVVSHGEHLGYVSAPFIRLS